MPPDRKSNAQGSQGTEARGSSLLDAIERRVDLWRGYPLSFAKDPLPRVAPAYSPTNAGEHEITSTTRTLLLHWFASEPHELFTDHRLQLFKYWPHQRKAVETFIYLHEVCRVRNSQDLQKLAGMPPKAEDLCTWPRLGGQLATGSGKTKIMALLIAWNYFNAIREDNADFCTKHTLLLAPGLFVKDRLLQDFLPKSGPSVFFTDPVLPPAWRSLWQLGVYTSETCPAFFRPQDAALIITNYHALLRRPQARKAVELGPVDRMSLLFDGKMPAETYGGEGSFHTSLLSCQRLFVINDEAHHLGDGKNAYGAQTFDNAHKSNDEKEIAQAWLDCLLRLKERASYPEFITCQIDLSATLYEEGGSHKRAGATVFRPRQLFSHTVVSYSLAEAIHDDIVKRPVLEKLEVFDVGTDEPHAAVQTGRSNAWERYGALLNTGIMRWQRVRDEMKEKGDLRNPILFILCADRTDASEVANYLRYGRAVKEDLAGLTPTGFRLDGHAEPLFVHKRPDGRIESEVVEIHIGEKENKGIKEWQSIRHAINEIDARCGVGVAATGTLQKPREDVPTSATGVLSVVVSVMMLKEGWDVRNVKVIVPLRPCTSRTLTEQVLGRGLRRMNSPVLKLDGSALLAREKLFVVEHPSFATILDQIGDLFTGNDEAAGGDEEPIVLIDARTSEDTKKQFDVRLITLISQNFSAPPWQEYLEKISFAAFEERFVWRTQHSKLEVFTVLQEALSKQEEEGFHFSLSEEASYHQFDRAVETIYVLPLLEKIKIPLPCKTKLKQKAKEFLATQVFASEGSPTLASPAQLELDEGGALALTNVCRREVIEEVSKHLAAALVTFAYEELAINDSAYVVRHVANLPAYRARRNFLVDARKSMFLKAACESAEEATMASCFDAASDVLAWVYNHRQGVGYHLGYLWNGAVSRYFPDFIVRACVAGVHINMIVEVKGRLDDRDKAKAERARIFCETISEKDQAKWIYVLVVENEGLGRLDVSWWRNSPNTKVEALLAHLESQPAL